MSERTSDILKKIKDIQSEIINFPVPITVDEKQELTEADARTFQLLLNMKVEKLCATCEHCVFYNTQYCCSVRNMAPIPFEVQNRAGGCSKWAEKGFIPF